MHTSFHGAYVISAIVMCSQCHLETLSLMCLWLTRDACNIRISSSSSSSLGHAGANMVGTLPPIYESLPDLSLLFVANNPGNSVSPQCFSALFWVHTLSSPRSAHGRHLCSPYTVVLNFALHYAVIVVVCNVALCLLLMFIHWHVTHLQRQLNARDCGCRFNWERGECQ